ncbi:uncharacterized protein LOC122383324 [Amphibalanus amphitrite]|uniref:uncharacterized protein LOC122383324 n=1 Tax=Amphibalanus amphitrite TaxID=1232801 RepID=UPI001C9055CE|nr:uncharacterized protein LOC122383324 [Amphibalanus amphitrite]
MTPALCAAVIGILGAAKVKDTAAMARGRRLEPLVIREVEKHLGEKIASSSIAFLAAVNILRSLLRQTRYIGSNDSRKINAQKHVAQIQLLMLKAQCKMTYFCVADPSFETNRQVTIVSVDYDEM